MAVVTLLDGLGVLPLGENGWNAIGPTILIGVIALSCLPEMLFGKYRRDRSRSAVEGQFEMWGRQKLFHRARLPPKANKASWDRYQ